MYAQSSPTLATPWITDHQVPLVGPGKWDFPGKNIGAGCISHSKDLPDPGIEPSSLESPALAGGFFTTSATWEAPGK